MNSPKFLCSWFRTLSEAKQRSLPSFEQRESPKSSVGSVSLHPLRKKQHSLLKLVKTPSAAGSEPS